MLVCKEEQYVVTSVCILPFARVKRPISNLQISKYNISMQTNCDILSLS